LQAFHVMVGEASARPAPPHQYVLLTKRPQRAAEFLKSLKGPPMSADPVEASVRLAWREYVPAFKRVLLMASVWDQASADAACSAFDDLDLNWGLHVEPMLGPICLSTHTLTRTGLSWVVCGSENGPGARPFDLKWARDLQEQCASFPPTIPFWFKNAYKQDVPLGLVRAKETPWV
jgi:protein gp37